VIHTPSSTVRWPLPFTFSTFDYRTLCGLLREQGRRRASSRRRPSSGIETGPVHVVHTDRGEMRAPLVVDALGWRRVLSGAAPIQPPAARLSRGLEVHPDGSGERPGDLDRPPLRAAPATAGASRPPTSCGSAVGSFEPRDHVKDRPWRWPGARRRRGALPGQLDPARAAGGDAGRRLLRRRLRRPLPAADRRGHPHRFYFALACGRELRGVIDASRSRGEALRRYHRFSAGHATAFAWMLRAQRLVPQGRAAPAVAVDAGR
jgi:hypothetical protein